MEKIEPLNRATYSVLYIYLSQKSRLISNRATTPGQRLVPCSLLNLRIILTWVFLLNTVFQNGATLSNILAFYYFSRITLREGGAHERRRFSVGAYVVVYGAVVLGNLYSVHCVTFLACA